MISFLLAGFTMAGPDSGFTQSRLLTKVGYVDIDRLTEAYITRFFNWEIEWRERYLSEIRVPPRFLTGQAREEELENWILEHCRSLDYLKSSLEQWERNGEIYDPDLREQLHYDILLAIRKTAVMEGFSIIISNTGNFVYGTDEAELTGKVLFRLDSQLMDRQTGDPPLLRGHGQHRGALGEYENWYWYRSEDPSE